MFEFHVASLSVRVERRCPGSHTTKGRERLQRYQLAMASLPSAGQLDRTAPSQWPGMAKNAGGRVIS
jgi:hypothetical protein